MFTVCICNFLQMEINEIAVHNMLVKLTTGNIIFCILYVFCFIPSLELMLSGGSSIVVKSSNIFVLILILW